MIKKAIYLFALVAMLSACNTHRNATMQNSLLVGTWQQPSLTLDLKSNGHYDYHYNEDSYSYEQSGKFSYFADKDSVVLYGFYPDTYTDESKNERWTICKLTPDSLTVYVHKNIVILNGDTLNTAGNEIEIYSKIH